MKTSIKSVFVITLLIVLGIVGCAPSRRNIINGKIVFQLDQDGNYDLYIMNQDGSEQQNLTNVSASVTSASNNTNPVPSPDGRKIAFESNRDGNNEIYVIDLASRTQLNLTKNTSNDYSPTWSPDGKNIIFISDRDAILLDAGRGLWTNNIYIMDADGSNTQRLTKENITSGYSGLAWSPDGKKLAFGLSSLTQYGSFLAQGINLMALSDSSLTKLISDQSTHSPKWSPDGKRIIFVSSQGGSSSIYVINIDKTDKIALTRDPLLYDTDPYWSPDGKQIVFSSRRDGGYHLYIMNADGSNQRPVTNGPGEKRLPAWLLEP